MFIILTDYIKKKERKDIRKKQMIKERRKERKHERKKERKEERKRKRKKNRKKCPLTKIIHFIPPVEKHGIGTLPQIKL